MLSLIFGPAGAGKTTAVQQEAAQLAAAGETVLLVVPGQFVFSSEQQLLHRAGGPSVRVLSFERMARLYGAEGSKTMDAAAKQALMSVALHRAAPQLELYSRLAGHKDFCRYALAAVHQFKMAGMDAAEVARLCERLEDGPLKRKLNDLWFIMAEYARVLGDRYFDPDDQLHRLRDLFAQQNPLAGACLFVDSFSDFTAAEYDLLALLMAGAKQTVVTLCGDREILQDQDRTLFAHPRKTALRLMRIAAENGIRVGEPRYLDGCFRGSAEIAAAETAYRKGVPAALTGDDVVVCACGGKRTEAEWVCARIRKLVIEEGFRYGEMTVICRNSEEWRGVLSSAMAANGIPFYCDFRKPISQTSVFRFTAAACRAAQRLDAASLIACCKTGFCRLSQQETGCLQDYLYVNMIQPEELTRPFADEDVERLRLRALEPLLKFAAAIQDTDAHGFAAAIYALLCDVDAEQTVQQLAAVTLPPELRVAAPDVKRGYNAYMELLDVFVETMREHRFSAEEYFEVLERMADALTLGEIPPVIDAVQFGSADLIRPQGARAVFVVGANDGVFPARPQPLYPFSQRETSRLSTLAEGLCEDVFTLAAREDFLVYTALFCAGERLSVSYHSGGGEDGGEQPSAFVQRLLEMIPADCRLDYSTLPAEQKVYSLHQARTALAETDGAVKQALSQTLIGIDPRYVSVYENARQFGPRKRGDEAGKLLFGGNMRLSSTRVEQFYTCRFRYFCQYGVGVTPLRRKKLDQLNYGTAFHYVLEQLLRCHCAQELLQMDDGELRRLIGTLLKQSGVPLTAGPGNSAKNQFVLDQMSTRLCGDVRSLCEGIAAGRFVPTDFEVGIGARPEDTVPPYTLRENGRELVYSGKVDRIDTYVDASGRRYLRIADYKTGNVEFDAQRLEDGLGLQMLYYAKAVTGGDGPYRDAVFAGFLYCPVNVGTASAGEGKAEQERAKKRRMKGLVLSDGVVDAAFGALGAYSAAKTVQDFSPYLETADRKLAQMAAELSEGIFDAAPNPALKEAGRICKYCDYRSVCFRRGTDAADPDDAGTSGAGCESTADGWM